MAKCVNCQAKLRRGAVEVTRQIGGHAFIGKVDADCCPNCDEPYIDGLALGRFELKVARLLAERGMVSGAAFKFMRKAIGMRAADLAALLGVAPETISRWENGQREVDRPSWVALASLVVDRAEGREGIINIARALDKKQQHPKSIRVDQVARKTA